jgi:hypothetical protein
MVKKIAMVQPKPVGADGIRPDGKRPTTDALDLIKILELMHNNRAYTVISHEGNTWVVHFEGDVEHMTITKQG